MSIDPVLRLELAHLVEQRFTWIVLAALFAAMLIGGAVGAKRVAADRALIERAVQLEANAIAEARVATELYSKPADFKVAQFRDPTDAYGYMYNFFTGHAVRRPAPLAALTIGQSEIYPSAIRVNFSDPFPDNAHELKSPRMLALGTFDLGFVLAYLLPLTIIALCGTLLASAHDAGILRMIASAPIKPRDIVTAKFGALAILFVPVVAGAAVVSLLTAGNVEISAGAGSLAMLALLTALYALFWIVASALAVSLWNGVVGSLAALVVGWTALTVLLPSLASLVLSAMAPAPSRIAYVEESRAAADAIAADPDSAERWLASMPTSNASKQEVVESPEVRRMSTQAFLRAALVGRRDAFAAHALATEKLAERFRIASPGLMFDGALQHLAGTEAAAQHRFVRSADAYSENLRAWFVPRVLARIGAERRCAQCPARLNFDAYNQVPHHVPFQAATDWSRLWWAALYLGVVTGGLGLLAAFRFRRWPA